MKVSAIFVSSMLVLLAPQLRAAQGFVNCQGYLMGLSSATDQKIFRETAHARFEDGLDEDDEIAAYVGISHEMMIDLLETGKIVIPDEAAALELVPTEEHSAGAALLKGDLSSRGYDWRRKAAIEIATYSARVHAAYAAVVHRQSRLHTKVLSPAAHQQIIQVLKALHIPNPKDSSKLFSPSFENLKDAIYLADIPMQPAGGRASGGKDAVISQKLLLFANELGLPTFLKDLKKSSWQAQFQSLFAGLPISKAYILGVGESQLVGQSKAHGAQTTSLGLDKVVGIEPLSDQGFHFLDYLKDN